MRQDKEVNGTTQEAEDGEIKKTSLYMIKVGTHHHENKITLTFHRASKPKSLAGACRRQQDFANE